MHGRAMRILLTYLSKLELRKMDEFPHHNLGLYVITYTNKKFKVEITNNLEHLKDENLI